MEVDGMVAIEEVKGWLKMVMGILALNSGFR